MGGASQVSHVSGLGAEWKIWSVPAPSPNGPALLPPVVVSLGRGRDRNPQKNFPLSLQLCHCPVLLPHCIHTLPYCSPQPLSAPVAIAWGQHIPGPSKPTWEQGHQLTGTWAFPTSRQLAGESCALDKSQGGYGGRGASFSK